MTIGSFFYGVLQENYFTIDNEFKPDGRVLKSFIQVSIKEDNIKLEFSYEDLNDKIRVDNNSIIIESKKIADKIREAMEGD